MPCQQPSYCEPVDSMRSNTLREGMPLCRASLQCSRTGRQAGRRRGRQEQEQAVVPQHSVSCRPPHPGMPASSVCQLIRATSSLLPPTGEGCRSRALFTTPHRTSA